LTIELHYGAGALRLYLPDSWRVDTYAPGRVERPVTFAAFARDFHAANGLHILEAGRPLVIVNDGHRSTPTATVLDWLDRLDGQFLDRALFLIATGTHAAPTDDHLAGIFGRHLRRVGARVRSHDATDHGSMMRVADDPLGGGLYLNRIVLEHEAVLVIGSVEPHYFAGYTGGRKSIFPGLTDLATVTRNHNLANSLEAAPLRLIGNPVAEHLDRLLATIDTSRFLSVQVVLDAGRRIAGCYCGTLAESFERATVLAAHLYAHHAPLAYDLILAEMLPPLDGNLYQGQKGVENCQAAVRDGGRLVLVSACEDGIGSDHFFDLARSWDRERNAPREGSPGFGSHKLSRVVTMSNRIGLLVCSDLDDDIVRQVFYEPLDNLQEFLYSSQNACEKRNVAVVQDAGNTVMNV